MINILIWLLASILSGILYRCGGAEPPFASWMRDAPCSIINIFLLGLFSWHSANLWLWVALLFTFGLNWGAYSSYWGEKTYYSLHALGLCVACLPYTIYSGHWWGFAIRAIVVIPTIIIWSIKNNKPVKEDIGRGIIFTSSLPLLLI